MQRFTKYVPVLILLIGGTMLLHRVLHRLTKVNTRLSQIKIEPYYLMHKDSTHYAVTFTIDNFNDRLGFYIGSGEKVANNKILGLLDTNNLYSLFIDETLPSYAGMNIGVRKIVLNGKTIYKESQLFMFLIGACCIIGAAGIIFYDLKHSKTGDSKE